MIFEIYKHKKKLLSIFLREFSPTNSLVENEYRFSFTKESLVEAMINSRDVWSGVARLCEEIMKGREELERQRQRRPTADPSV